MKEMTSDISDRKHVFYWQTDRAVSPEEAGRIWADRHRYFADEEIVSVINSTLDTSDFLEYLEPLDLQSQTNLGNVNSVRCAKLRSGRQIIIRLHPKGVKNGYFHVESLVANIAKEKGIPSYSTIAVHDTTSADDFAYQIIEKLPGVAVKKWLESTPDDENRLLLEIGKMMARLHQVEVEGFGPFDNEKAKSEKLAGIHATMHKAVSASLSFNLDVLQKEKIVSESQRVAILSLFASSNPLLQSKRSVLVHNDFADWNLLTDGTHITGVLDWDECIGGDPVSDIACWSTFFHPERLDKMLEGYFQVAPKIIEFDEKFQILRLRYIISKMTLRIRRYSWEPTNQMLEKIEIGKIHLGQSLGHFGI